MPDKSAPPTLLVTRPEPGASSFLSLLRERGYDVAGAVTSPALKIASLVPTYSLSTTDVVVFSSAHAAELAIPGAGLKALCVGDATARAALANGYEAMSAHGDGDKLINVILTQVEPGPLVYLRGQHARIDLAERLSPHGYQVEEHILYNQIELGPSAEAEALLKGAGPLLLPLFSPRSAANVRKWVRGSKASIHAVAMSQAVADAWNGPAILAQAPNARSMADAVQRYAAPQGNG